MRATIAQECSESQSSSREDAVAIVRRALDANDSNIEHSLDRVMKRVEALNTRKAYG